ncbi:hypothetical protein IMSAGC002_02995 [Lachnospiraceae bacterium]|nr:hypothetical protein IMSAGC002_02995 [Lachnospiraceae bacterium]
MTYCENNFQKSIFIAIALGLIISILVLGNRNSNIFLGIPLINSFELDNREYKEGFIDNFQLLYNGYQAPYIKESNLYIIPQDLSTADWNGVFSSSNAGCQLYIKNDTFINNKSKAIEENHIFQLYIVHNNILEKRQIIFSGLPIMVIKDDNLLRSNNNICGNLTFFDTNTVSFSQLEYHIKGNSTSVFDKKSYRINLKTETGNKNKISFLNLTETDDWVINALYTDDEKVREKLVADLWNEKCNENNESWQFPTVEYIEVVINDDYRGLYGLSTVINNDLERTDKRNSCVLKVKKYIDIDDFNWIGVKKDWERVGPFYMMIHNEDAVNPWENVKELSRRFYQNDTKDNYTFSQCTDLINLNNQIDSYLFVNGLNMTDNCSSNGVVYVYDGRTNTFIRLMHDFDAIFTHWEHDAANPLIVNRFSTERKNEFIADIRSTTEMEQLLSKNPELWSQIQKRWFYLRNSTFSTNNITQLIDSYRNKLQKSGIWIREKERWPDECMIADENWLPTFISKRLEYLDEYYNKEHPKYKD